MDFNLGIWSNHKYTRSICLKDFFKNATIYSKMQIYSFMNVNKLKSIAKEKDYNQYKFASAVKTVIFTVVYNIQWSVIYIKFQNHIIKIQTSYFLKLLKIQLKVSQGFASVLLKSNLQLYILVQYIFKTVTYRIFSLLFECIFRLTSSYLCNHKAKILFLATFMFNVPN